MIVSIVGVKQLVVAKVELVVIRYGFLAKSLIYLAEFLLVRLTNICFQCLPGPPDDMAAAVEHFIWTL